MKIEAMTRFPSQELKKRYVEIVDEQQKKNQNATKKNEKINSQQSLNY